MLRLVKQQRQRDKRNTSADWIRQTLPWAFLLGIIITGIVLSDTEVLRLQSATRIASETSTKSIHTSPRSETTESAEAAAAAAASNAAAAAAAGGGGGEEATTAAAANAKQAPKAANVTASKATETASQSKCALLEDDYEVAMCVHRSETPVLEAGRWVYRPHVFAKDSKRQHAQFSFSPAYLECLDRERQGNCYDPDAWKRSNDTAKLSRRDAMSKNAVVNSPGILRGQDPWVWEGASGSPLYASIPMDDQYTATAKRLLNVNGAQRRFFLIGDSLTRQWAHTMYCELVHIFNQTEQEASQQVQYIQVFDVRRDLPVGGKKRRIIETIPKEHDVVVWNTGHHVGPSKIKGTGVNGTQKWKDAYMDNIRVALNMTFGKVPDKHVFFRTTSVRHFLYGRGDWDTAESSAGGLAPDMNAKWSMYGGKYHAQPDQNLMALEILKQQQQVPGTHGHNFQLLDISPMMLARADASFDGSHFCLPGPHTFWSRMLYYQLQRRQTLR